MIRKPTRCKQLTAQIDVVADVPSAPELLTRAAGLVPALKQRAAHTEILRRIPAESVADILASGLVHIGVPKRFGGLGVPYGLCLDVAAEIGRACPSTAWCYGLWAAHAWLVGFWPLQAQEEVYGNGPDVLCSSSLNPGRSTCEQVSGGYRLSGRWEFSSGCDAAGWVMLGAPNIGERSWVLVPRDDFEIIDTWFVSGLRGSGSKDIALKDAFIPGHRVLDVNAAGVSDLGAWELHRQGRYRVPVSTLLGWDLVGPMLGIAQGMIDEFTARTLGTSGPGRTADSPAVHIRLAQATAEVDAAKGVMDADVREILRKGAEGEPFSMLERARFRRDKAFITQLCLKAVNGLFDLSGGHALHESVPLQRFHRDAQAVAHRDGLVMELGGLDYGRVLFGLPPNGAI